MPLPANVLTIQKYILVQEVIAKHNAVLKLFGKCIPVEKENIGQYYTTKNFRSTFGATYTNRCTSNAWSTLSQHFLFCFELHGDLVW